MPQTNSPRLNFCFVPVSDVLQQDVVVVDLRRICLGLEHQFQKKIFLHEVVVPYLLAYIYR